VVAENIIVAMAYWGLSHINVILFSHLGLFPMPIWPAAALALVVAFFRGLTIAPGIALGVVLADHFSLGIGWSYSLSIAIMNTLGPIAGAALMRNRISLQLKISDAQDLWFCFFSALILVPVLAASGGIGFKWLLGMIPAEAVPVALLKWALAHALATLFFALPAFAWIKGKQPITEPVEENQIDFIDFQKIAVNAGVFLAAFFWFADSLFKFLWFNGGFSFLSVLVSFDDAERLIMRIMFCSAFILGGIIVGIFLDRLKAQQEVSRRIAIDLEITLNSIGDAVIVTDVLGSVVRMNPIAQTLTGWSLTDAKDKPLTEVYKIINSKTREIADNPVNAVLGGSAVIAFANHSILISKNGNELHIADSAAPILNGGDNLLGIVLVFRDTTKHHQMNARIIDSEEKYRSMMNAMEDDIYICSSGYKIEYMNSSMAQKIGEEGIGKTCHELLYDRNQKCPWCIHPQVMNGETISYEMTNPKDNRMYYVNNSPVFKADGMVSKLVIFRDITKIKKLEANIQQSQKLESIGTLAGGIAHDFNNILSSVIGFTEIALDDELPKDSPARDSLQNVLQAGFRAKDLVKQILTFSREAKCEKSILSLGLIVTEVMKLLRSSLPANIEIRQSIIAKNTQMLGDPSQIHQIIMNLGTNAGYAMRNTGGTLDVTVSSIDFASEYLNRPFGLKAGAYIELTVNDTGQGIDSSVLNKIFDPFFSTKPKDEGTGLGLSMVHGIVKGHDGAIIVDSKINKGTVFKVYFPQLTDLEESEKSDLGSLPELFCGNERILIVDDEITVGDMTKKKLEHLGYKVTLVTSSPQALEIFTHDPHVFDLVITDMTMPELTGDRLARKLLSIRPGIPIILCTGYSHIINREQAMAVGVSGFLMKPIAHQDLAKTIRRVLIT
jgi:PAS domain S-box-containing protein